MSTFHKTLLYLIIAAFPAGVLAYFMIDARRGGLSASSAPAREELESVLKRKSDELAAIDLQIVTMQGELLKFRSRKDEEVKSLEAMRDRIVSLLDQVRQGEPAKP